jgi:hypothetical protein
MGQSKIGNAGDEDIIKPNRSTVFWDTMGTQLHAYIIRRTEFEKELGDTEWCLPATLKAIPGILETLIPQKDFASVEQTFNAELGNWVANPEEPKALLCVCKRQLDRRNGYPTQ